MTIKHMPCGLFWHFNSGLEMSPALPLPSDSIAFGCRVDGGESDAVTLFYKKKNAEQWSAQSGQRQQDDKRYYSFNMPPLNEICEVEYYFVANDETAQIKSSTYSFSTLNKIDINFQTVVTDEHNLLTLQSNNAKGSKLIFNKASGNFLITYLIDKTTYYRKNYDDIKFETRVEKDILVIAEKQSKKEVAQLSLKATALMDANDKCAALSLSIKLPGVYVFGGGEKFDKINLQGTKYVCNVVEQYANQNDKTYLPIPFLYTEQKAGILQTSSMRTDFVFEKQGGHTAITLNTYCLPQNELIDFYFIHGEPKEQIKKYLELTGAQALAPKWAFGPWISSNGWNTQTEALEQIEKMNELKIPATVQVLEAWSDEETFYIWNDAKYSPTEKGIYKYSDFTFSKDGKWPNPKEFVQILKDNNIKLILWQIPVIKYERAPHGEQLDLDEKYAIENKLCIQNKDNTPYRITEMWFGNSLMPDFTNTETKKWWFDKRRYLIEELGVAGFKTDGGEFLFDTAAVMHDKRTGAQAHNEYPNLYVGAYHEFMSEAAGAENVITFSRAGYTGAQKYPIHWAGDQVSSWSELRGQLTAGLSLGLSGVPFWSFDIGDFAGEFPSTELYLRAAALAAFSPVMQFHSEPRNGQYYMTERERWNNDRSPWNIAAANKDDTVISVYRMLANLRMNLLPYIWDSAKNCVRQGRPMMAHLLYDYPHDNNVFDIDDEFMFGEQMLVAPIIYEGIAQREIYLPDGAWRFFASGEKYRGGKNKIKCAIEEIPVFVKENSVIPINLNHDFIVGTQDKNGAISNNVNKYEVFAFLVFGDANYKFEDELGNKIAIKSQTENISVTGSANNLICIVPMTDFCRKYTINKCEVKTIKVLYFNKEIDGYCFGL